MALFKIFRGSSLALPEGLHDGYAYFTTDDGKFYIDTATKRTLINPDSPGTNLIHSKTTAEWNSQPILTQVNHIYVYTDHQQDEQGNPVPGIKIGTGNAYVADLPFIDTVTMDHINNTDIHVSAEDRAYWDEKFQAYYSANVNNLLVLKNTTRTYN